MIELIAALIVGGILIMTLVLGKGWIDNELFKKGR